MGGLLARNHVYVPASHPACLPVCTYGCIRMTYRQSWHRSHTMHDANSFPRLLQVAKSAFMQFCFFES